MFVLLNISRVIHLFGSSVHKICFGTFTTTSRPLLFRFGGAKNHMQLLVENRKLCLLTLVLGQLD